MLTKLYTRYGKKKTRVALGILIALLALGGIFATRGGEDTSSDTATATQIVHVAPAGELAVFGQGVSVIGTVTAVNEAEVKSEIGGQLTAVNVAIGDRVDAGTVLATFENASERAAVLQAEGAYEAALASAQQSDIGAGASAEDVLDAKINAWNEYRSAFVTTSDIMHTTLDEIFGDYNRQLLSLSDFTTERRAIRYNIETWGDRSRGLAPQEVEPSLVEAQRVIEELTAFIDKVYEHISRVERQSSDATVEAAAATYKADLTTARTSLNSATGSLTSARAALQSTQADYAQAQIAGTGGVVSAADAAVKQALGSLRSAQATLEKTIVRSPIAGSVNTVHVKRGAYVGAASPIAMVVSEGALEVSAYLTEGDRDRLAIGDSVSFGDGATGTVTRIAPSIDRTTQKYEVKISPDTDELEPGDVVRVLLPEDAEAAASLADTPLFIPLSAVKLTAESAVVFSVADGRLVEHEVALGEVRGTSVRITEGLTRDAVIVADARGLAAGDIVRIAD